MKNKIKILETIRQGKVGGGERHLLDIVENIDRDEFEPIVLAFTDGEMIDRCKEIGVQAHVIQTEKGFDRSVWPLVSDFAQECEIDILHAHGTRAYSNSYKTAKKLDIPLIYTVHYWSFHDDQKFPQKDIRKFCERQFVKHATGTIFVCEDNQNYGLKHFDVGRHHLVKNTVDIPRFTRENVTINRREELNIPQDRNLVGFISRMTEQKDPFTMLKAFSIVKDKLPNVDLLLVGDGNLKAQVDKMILELKLSDRIHVLPARTDIPELLNILDVFCLPSLWDALSISILEAMSMKLPVIATAVGDTPELVIENETGFLIPVKAPEKLADAILKFYERKDFYKERYGAKARKMVEEFYSVERKTTEMETIYREYKGLSFNS